MRTRATSTVDITRNLRAQLAEAMRIHAQHCRTCVNLTQTASRYCDEGYEIAKRYRRADTEVNRLEAQSAVDQPALF